MTDINTVLEWRVKDGARDYWRLVLTVDDAVISGDWSWSYSLRKSDIDYTDRRAREVASGFLCGQGDEPPPLRDILAHIQSSYFALFLNFTANSESKRL